MRTVLLDSHFLVWFKTDEHKIPVGLRTRVTSTDYSVYISMATWWELIIKERKGKLVVPEGVEGLYHDWIRNGIAENLDIGWNHLEKLRDLPEIHSDPFDRIMVAQSLMEDLTIITLDSFIPRYPGVKTLWDLPELN
ncbi:MAG: type II toxin-antitoxin system VapC family toxin [Candidatus Methylacidiphilales bacterium]